MTWTGWTWTGSVWVIQYLLERRDALGIEYLRRHSLAETAAGEGADILLAHLATLRRVGTIGPQLSPAGKSHGRRQVGNRRFRHVPQPLQRRLDIRLGNALHCKGLPDAGEWLAGGIAAAHPAFAERAVVQQAVALQLERTGKRL